MADGTAQAVRFGRWKAVRANRLAPTALYDLHRDWQEVSNIAATHPTQVRHAEQFLAGAVGGA